VTSWASPSVWALFTTCFSRSRGRRTSSTGSKTCQAVVSACMTRPSKVPRPCWPASMPSRCIATCWLRSATATPTPGACISGCHRAGAAARLHDRRCRARLARRAAGRLGRHAVPRRCVSHPAPVRRPRQHAGAPCQGRYVAAPDAAGQDRPRRPAWFRRRACHPAGACAADRDPGAWVVSRHPNAHPVAAP